jgi:hypothetical protein
MEEGVNDLHFARFDPPENGIPALDELLINYAAKTACLAQR